MATSNDTTKTYSIYRIVCIENGKTYIGQTVAPRIRENQHWWHLRRGIHGNVHLQSAYNQYGRKGFYFEVLEENIHGSEINKREQEWIKAFDSFKNGYNRTEGGSDFSITRNKSCKWNGVEYISISAAARACGLNPSSMQERLSRGLKCDDDLVGAGKKQPRAKSVVWNGIKYNSLSEASRACGIKIAAMAERISKGYTCDNDLKRQYVKPRTVIWLGIEYPNMTEAAKAHGLTTTGLKNRIAKGFTENDIRRKK